MASKKMAENGPSPAKRMRYNLRSAAQLDSNDTTSEKTDHRSTYKRRLRSGGQINDNEIPSIDALRKQRANKKPPVTTLLSLNPDCLLRMFEHMSLVDLCSMAKTCTTINAYAKYYFRLKHKNFNFSSMLDDEFLTVDKATELLRTFGDQIYALKVQFDLFEEYDDDDDAYYDDEDTSTELLWTIGQNCQQNLKVLTLDSIVFTSGILGDCAQLFNSIEALTLHQCTMYNSNWCDMNNLKVLKLIDVSGFRPYFWQAKFEKLETVELNHLDIDTDNLIEFILMVPTIKRLSIVKCWNTSIKIFGVVKLLENLEEFEYQLNHPIRLDEIHDRHMADLTLMKKLKVLKVTCNGKNVQRMIDGFVEEKIAIEHLELVDGVMDIATAKAIAKLNTIKVLKFNDMMEFHERSLVPITNGLNQLEEFHIKTTAKISQFRIKEFVRALNDLTGLNIDAKDFDLNADTCHAILNAVRNRAHTNHLTMKIYGDENQSIVPVSDVVLNGSKEVKWLTVHRLDRSTNGMFPHYPWTADMEDFNYDFDTDDEFDLEFDSDFSDDEY